ncbi:MAG: hypothetical protein RL510_656 [Actinomycetota bacterium]|jgi:hypothetical protein
MKFLLFLATTEPIENDAEKFYSPGVLGFIFTFAMAGLAIVLIFDMVRRMRKVRYRAEVQEKLAAEAADRGVKRNK